jgi:sugar O-acyltransferase (sialic acid O-acetyltransferase NeuD family)
MSRTLVILGAGGFAREAYWHARETRPELDEFVFVDDVTPLTSLDLAGRRYVVVKDWRFDAGLEFIVGVGSPKAKRILVEKARAAGLIPAATIVHPEARVQGHDCIIGRGGVITPGCVVTTNVKIGDFVILNLNSTVGHDTVIGDYATVSPLCAVSGKVTLGNGVTLGTATAIREGITLAPGVVTGAHACVVDDVLDPDVTIVGIPAKILRKP